MAEPAGTTRSTKSDLAQAKALIAEQRFVDARIHVEAAIERHPEDLRLADVLVGLLRRDGEVDAALTLAVSNAERWRDRFEETREPRRPERPLDRHERVMISGYFYSGSSAILDFLTDHRGCVKWSPAGEMRLVKFPGGLDALASSHATGGELTATALVDLYLHLCGRRVETVPKGTYSRWGMVNRNSRKLHRKPTARGYLLRCYQHYLDLIARSREGPIGAEELEDRLRTWVEAALDAAAADTGADRLIVDQAVTAWKMPIARFLPPSTFIVVHRDPRDQFTEAKEVLARPGRKATTPTRFAASYLRRRRTVRQAIPSLERDHGHRFLSTSFERFVVHHQRTADWIIDELQMRDVPRVANDFDPEVSRQNVGKHREGLTFAERSLLRVALLPYISRDARPERR
jgi:hypothetical protein